MSEKDLAPDRSRLWPWVAIAVVLAAAAVQLRVQGRSWICSTGQVRVWVGDIWSSDNSQHLFDPYTFTHLLHGVVFFWVLAWRARRLPMSWRLCVAMAVEALWEVVENSAFVIQRYREATLALGYEGDTIVNSLADIAVCALGFAIARRLGLGLSIVLFVATEVVLVLWIRDSLVLSALMLICPIDALKTWQMGQ